MGLFRNKNIIAITEEDLNDAKLSSLFPKEELNKKRAFMDVLGARLALRILFSQKFEANNIYSMYTSQNVLEKIDLADIYLDNIKFDVRLVFNSDEIFVPRSHFDYEITPDIYFALCLNNDLTSAEFIGFFTPDQIDKNNCNSDFYFISKDSITPADEFKKTMKKFSPKEPIIVSENKKEEIFGKLLAFIDSELNYDEEKEMLQVLANNIDLREKLVELENFEELSNRTANSGLLQDNFFDVIGAQQVTDDKLPEGAEEVVIDLNDNDNKPEDNDNNIEETDKDTDKDNNSGLATGATLLGGAIAGGIIAGATAANASEAGIAGSTAEALGSATISGVGAGAKAGADIASNLASNTADLANNILSDKNNASENTINTQIPSSSSEDFDDIINSMNDEKNTSINKNDEDEIEFTNNDDFNFDDLTSDNNNEFSDFDDILSDTKNEDDESSISFNDTADDVEYNIDNNSDDDEKISTDDYTNENKDSESDRFNISPDELPDFEDLPDFSENEIAEDVEIEENTENILENTDENADENTNEIESESTDLPISDTTEGIKSGDEQDKEIENTEIPEQEIPTDTTSESNIGNIDFDNIDDLDEQISAEATPESDITESSDIENDLFSETKDLLSQFDENVEDVENVEDIKDAEEAQTTESQTEINDINNFNEEPENTKAEEIETSQADNSTSETDNEENVNFDNETISQDDEDIFTSKLPEIDFGSISNDAEQNLGDTEPEIIEEKIEDKSSSSDDDELSPVEQLESNPDAVEALKSKIKDKQIANMPNYFSNLQETADDDADEPDEKNEELENNELREDSSNSNNEEENNVSEITDSETALPELNLEEVPELKENEEGLVSLNAFDELPETNAVSEEEKPKEDVVSLDNFDFDMFEKKVEEEGPVKVDLPNKDNTPNAEPTEIENTNSDNVNKTTQNEATASDSIDDLDSAIEDNEVADITSQVDAFLNEVDLDDEQKDILSTEVDIDESLLSTDVPNIDESIEELPTTEEEETTTTNPTEVSETTAFPTETGLISEPVNEYQTEAIGDETHAEYGEAEPETLEYLFNKDKESEDEIELEETEPIGKKAFLKDKKMVTAAIVCAIFATMTITTVIKNVNQPKDAVFPKDMNSQENVVPTAPNGMTPAGTPAGDAQNPNVPGAIGTTNGGTVANQPPQDMGKAVSNAFTTQAINAQVSKIAWEVPESLSYSVGFRRYLQTAGKNLKLSLQSDLLLATEMAYSNKCVIDVVVSNSGNIQSLGLITSSGSKQIDNIVLQSVKETLNYLKAPANELNGKSADLTLIINF